MSESTTSDAAADDRSVIRVLLVDDQELFRAGVAIMIDAQPDLAVVGQAADGLRGVALCEELQPDVLLMDIRMPEMDGVEPLVRSSRPSELLPGQNRYE